MSSRTAQNIKQSKMVAAHPYSVLF